MNLITFMVFHLSRNIHCQCKLDIGLRQLSSRGLPNLAVRTTTLLGGWYRYRILDHSGSESELVHRVHEKGQAVRTPLPERVTPWRFSLMHHRVG